MLKRLRAWVWTATATLARWWHVVEAHTVGRERRWRLAAAAFVFVVFLVLLGVHPPPSVAAPLYALLAAAAFAAERMPVSHDRREIDLVSATSLQVIAGASALMAGMTWLISTPDTTFGQLMGGVVITLAGVAFVSHHQTRIP